MTGDATDSTPPALVYVLGRGHSGSTLLDVILGNARGAIDVGEFSRGAVEEESAWAEAEPGGSAPFWSRVRAVFEAESGLSWAEGAGAIAQQSTPLRFLRTLLAHGGAEWVRRLRAINEAMIGAIAQVAGASLVVESSKEVSRGLFLIRFQPRIHEVYLCRNAHHVVASDLYHLRTNKRFRLAGRPVTFLTWEPAFVAVASLRWLVGSALAELVRLFAPTRVLRLRFEDLLAAPEAQLDRLETFLDCDLETARTRIRAGEPLSKGPQIAGNPGLHGRTGVVLDRSGRDRPLPRWGTVLVGILCWPLLLLYNYPLVPPTTH